MADSETGSKKGAPSLGEEKERRGQLQQVGQNASLLALSVCSKIRPPREHQER
jgi:hypothetical protein